MDYDVIVIGAGVGGLSAGAALAKEGLKTLVLEQADFVGGCASSFENSGFHFDVGACIIELIGAHETFYQRLGVSMEDYITFLPNDPIYELVDILSGERFAVPASAEGMAELIGRHSAADAQAFLRFMREDGKMMDEFTNAVFTTPQCNLMGLFKVFARYPRAIMNLHRLMLPFNKVMADLFVHPFTRRLLCNSSVIGGLPPSRQAGMMLWQSFAEHDGFYYPRGGMGAVPRAMARALEDVGGELRFESRVERLVLERKAARGVVLSDGTVLTSRAVVSNANATNLYLEMVGEENIPRAVAKGLRSYEPSPTCAVCYLGLDYQPPLQAQHIMALADPELIDLFWSDIYAKGTAIPQSVGLISSPSYMDSSLAPEGGAALSFISMAPRHPQGVPWSEMKWDYLEQGINMLDAVYIPGIKEHVVFKTIATPEDFERRLLIPGGTIYAYSMSVLSQMVFRPSNRSKCVKNLYLSGASTHPSGSVPGALYGGLIAADLVLKDLNGG
ncbi:MAG: NAD(P)/FAD-dependent oxidoreductase [Actinobacteria bacterium]|jgi:phytoene desaturase|nr:MAG: NAD(P)/FAD-dependent oxidoreductase [Actinomycetota bacterium]